MVVPDFPSALNASGTAAPFVATYPGGTQAFVLDTPSGVYKGAADPNTASVAGDPTGLAGQSSHQGATGAGLGIDVGSGQASYAAPLLSIGSKGSPYSLEFDVAYSSQAGAQHTFATPDAPGWSHNFEISLHQNSDPFALLGSDLAMPAVPGITAMFDLLLTSNAVAQYYTNGGSYPMDAVFRTSVAASWFLAQATGSSATISKGGAQEAFARMADGTWATLTPSGEKLSYSGSGWVWTGAHGDTMNFPAGGGQIGGATSANGVVTSFAYTNSGGSPSYKLLQTVSSGGHSLTFEYGAAQLSGGSPKLARVWDELGRTVVLTLNPTNPFELSSIALVDSTASAPRKLSFGYGESYYSFMGEAGNYGDVVTLLQQVVDPANTQTWMSYDRRQLATSMTNANGHKWSYYTSAERSEIDDPLGNESSSYSYPVATANGTTDDETYVNSFDALGNQTVTHYNNAGQLLAKYLPLAAWGCEYRYTYDAHGNLASTSSGAVPGTACSATTTQITTSTDYDQTWNKPSYVTDPLGNVTVYSYDGHGNLVQVVHPAVIYNGKVATPTESYAYLGDGQISAATAADGEVTSYGYGSNGNLQTVVVDSGRQNLTTTYGYDAVGNVTSTKNPRGYVTTSQYDAARRPTTVITPPVSALGGAVDYTDYTYDADGRLTGTAVLSPLFGTPLASQTTYDAVGNVLKQTVPTTGSVANAGVTSTTYDADERVATVTSPTGQVTSNTYDADSRPHQVLDGTGHASQTYTYTLDDLVNTLSDGNGHTITYAYDFDDRQTLTTYADGSSEQVTLNAASEVLTRRNRAGVTIAFQYDNMGRTVSESDPGSSTPIGMAYDLVGRALTVSDQSGTFAYAYDSAGHQFRTTRPDGRVLTYAWDPDGNLGAQIYPDGTIYNYGFDELDRETGVAETPVGSTTATNLAHYSYDGLSRLQGLTYVNGTSTNYGYDAFDGLVTIAHQFVGTGDAAGVTATYTRDAAERRIGDTLSVGTYLWHPPAGGTVPYQPNSLNQYTAIGGQTLGYNGRGNLRADPTASLGAASYGWDLKNRLVSATNTQNVASYGYDAFSRRSSKVVNGVSTVIVNDGDREIADYDGAGNELRRYVYGLGSTPILEELTTGSGVVTTSWFHHVDALGGTMAVTDGSGAVVYSYATSAWGEIAGGAAGAVGTPYRFAGMQLDPETLLYYDHARYYSAEQGRFLSPDPIGVKGGINIYAYVGNDPLNGTDLSGKGGPWWDTHGELYKDLAALHWSRPGSFAYQRALKNLPFDDHAPIALNAGGNAALLGGYPESGGSFSSDGTYTFDTAPTYVAQSGNGQPYQVASLGPVAAPVAPDFLNIIGAGLSDALGALGAVLSLSGDTMQTLNHYTTSGGYQGITADGEIFPSGDGYTYVTPTVYAKGADAQAALALSQTPIGYFQIPVSDLPGALPPSIVQPWNGQPGGGIEVRVPGSVSVANATWVPIK